MLNQDRGDEEILHRRRKWKIHPSGEFSDQWSGQKTEEKVEQHKAVAWVGTSFNGLGKGPNRKRTTSRGDRNPAGEHGWGKEHHRDSWKPFQRNWL